jgi:hypothetical protein
VAFLGLKVDWDSLPGRAVQAAAPALGIALTHLDTRSTTTAAPTLTSLREARAAGTRAFTARIYEAWLDGRFTLLAEVDADLPGRRRGASCKITVLKTRV